MIDAHDWLQGGGALGVGAKVNPTATKNPWAPVMLVPTSADEHAFARLCLTALETYRRKNADYGDAWKRLGLRGVYVRWYDKTQRLLRLLWQGAKPQVADEGTRDTLADALLYNLMALVLYDRGVWDGSEGAAAPSPTSEVPDAT